MTLPVTITCPHCGASNPSGSQFCESCGKALPIAGGTGPRVLTAGSTPATTLGYASLSDDMTKHTRRARNTLFGLGVLALVGCGIFFALSQNAPAGEARQTIVVVAATYAVIGVLFLALGFWANRSPLPATIVGAVIYGTVLVIGIASWANELGQPGVRPRSPIGLLDIIVILFLARGIQAGLAHRRLTAGRAA